MTSYSQLWRCPQCLHEAVASGPLESLRHFQGSCKVTVDFSIAGRFFYRLSHQGSPFSRTRRPFFLCLFHCVAICPDGAKAVVGKIAPFAEQAVVSSWRPPTKSHESDPGLSLMKHDMVSFTSSRPLLTHLLTPFCG